MAKYDAVAAAAFWNEQREKQKRHFEDICIEVVLSGGAMGADMLSPELGILVDWNYFNEEALKFVDLYLSPTRRRGVVGSGIFDWVNTLTDTTRDATLNEIKLWARSGEPLPILEQRLAPWFGETRAHRVAVTEVTRVYSEGNLMVWQSTPAVTGKRWMTAVDERVCPVCGSLHNTITEIDGTWNFTDEMLEANPEVKQLLKSPTALRTAPAHVLCRCYMQPVVLRALSGDELAKQFFNPR